MNIAIKIRSFIRSYDWRVLLQFTPAFLLLAIANFITLNSVNSNDDLSFDLASVDGSAANLSPIEIGRLDEHFWVPFKRLDSARPHFESSTIWIRVPSRSGTIPKGAMVAHTHWAAGVKMELMATSTAKQGEPVTQQNTILHSQDPGLIGSRQKSQDIKLPFSIEAPATYYIRLTIPPLIKPYFSLLESSQRLTHKTAIETWVEILSGGLFIATIINFFSYVATRRRTFLLVGGYTLCIFLEALVQHEFLSNLIGINILTDQAIDRLVLIIVALGYLLMVFYVREEIKDTELKTDLTIKIAFAAAIANITMTIVAPISLITIILASSGSIFWLMLAILMTRHHSMKPDSALVANLSSIFTSDCLILASWYGLAEFSEYSSIFHKLGTLISGSIIFAQVARYVAKNKVEQKSFERSLISEDATLVNSEAKSDIQTLDATIVVMEIYNDSGQIPNHSEPSDRHEKQESDLLTQNLEDLMKTIKAYGGNLDRCYSGGLICFFSSNDDDHTQKALNAVTALRLRFIADHQRHKTSSKSSNKLAFKVGIHTGSVILGKIGIRGNLNHAIVGHDLILASQVAHACPPYRIMTTEQSKQKLVARGFPNSQFHEVKIPLADSRQISVAFEYLDDHMTNQTILEMTRLLLRTELKRESDDREERFFPAQHCQLNLVSEFGSFLIEDFAASGFRTKSSSFLASGVQIEMQLLTNNDEVNQRLENKLIDRMTIEVRWSHRIGSGFQHGFKIVGDNEAQRQHRLALLSIYNTAIQYTDMTA